MKNYVLLLRANTNMLPAAFSDPKELRMRTQWLENLKDTEIIVSPGGTMPPTQNTAMTIFANHTEKEGPFTEKCYFLTGYLVIRSVSLESARMIAQTNPILSAGGSVEIREVMLR